MTYSRGLHSPYTDYITDWTIGVQIPAGVKGFLFSRTSRLAMRPNQPPI